MELEQELTPEMVQELREKAREDLYFFAKGILGYGLMSKSVHLELCRVLQDEGSTEKLVVLPRGWFKTTICSIAYPIWLAVRNPNVRILLVQNTFTNAMAKLSSIKAQFEGNDLLRTLFPEVLPGPESKWKGESLCLKRNGMFPESTFECAGIGTQVVSRHYDLIIEDDTVAPDIDELGEDNLVPTKDDIDQAIGFHKLTLPLLVDPGASCHLVVGTRWFEKDLISWVKASEPSYRVYERSCRETDGLPDPAGQPAFPERFGEAVLQKIEAAMGPYLYSCLYMNLPLRSKDMVFRPEWFEYYETEEQDLLVYTTVDPAGDPDASKAKKKGRNDYNVVMTCGKSVKTGRIYVLDYVRKKCNPGELIDEIFAHVRKWHPLKVGIESVAYQNTLMYWVRQRMTKESTYFMLDMINHNSASKNVRIMGLQPVVQNKLLRFRQWMGALVNELLVFPLGVNDDLADTLAMQMPLWAITSQEQFSDENRDADNPMVLENVIENIRGRDNAQAEGFVFDVFNGIFAVNQN